MYNRIIFFISVIACCFSFQFALGQNAAKTIETLVALGYENISCDDADSERVYVLENVAYRLNGVGIAKAVEIIEKNGMPENKLCRLIFLDNNVPQISICFKPLEMDSIGVTKEWQREISYDLGPDWRKYTKGKKINSSLYKVDIVVYPELSFKNLIITQIYQVLFNLSPAVEVSLWKGMKLTGQVVFPVYNDGYGLLAGKIHPGFITLQQSVRLPYNIWSSLTVGLFNNGRYGADLHFFHPFKDERFSVEGQIGVTAPYYWNNFDFYYNTKTRLTWSLGGAYYWPRFNTQLSVKLEQYLLGECGVRVDMVRHFRYCSIGFYAMKADGAKANGGFRFQVALPPYRYKRSGYIPKITPSKNMGITYNAGNDQVNYQNYRTNPSVNMMQENIFNPYFIKSELLNF